MKAGDIRRAHDLLDAMEQTRREFEQLRTARRACVELYDEDGFTHASIELFDENGTAIGGIIDLDHEIVAAVRVLVTDRLARKISVIGSQLLGMGVEIGSEEHAA